MLEVHGEKYTSSSQISLAYLLSKRSSILNTSLKHKRHHPTLMEQTFKCIFIALGNSVCGSRTLTKPFWWSGVLENRKRPLGPFNYPNNHIIGGFVWFEL